jgi:hypothetical protein
VFSNLPATSEYVATACSGFQGGGGTARALQGTQAAWEAEPGAPAALVAGSGSLAVGAPALKEVEAGSGEVQGLT